MLNLKTIVAVVGLAALATGCKPAEAPAPAEPAAASEPAPIAVDNAVVAPVEEGVVATNETTMPASDGEAAANAVEGSEPRSTPDRKAQ